MSEAPSKDIAKDIIETIPKAMRFIRAEMRHFATSDPSSQLTVPQFRILAKTTRGSFTHKEVADWMGISPATLTRMVDTLVHRELVTRKIDTVDRRQTLLLPTAEGRSFAEKYRKKVQTKIDQRLDQLDAEERLQLQKGLRVLAKVFAE